MLDSGSRGQQADSEAFVSEGDRVTALIVPVDEASELQSFRQEYIHRPGRSMPPHVTVHSPFLSIDEIEGNVLTSLESIFAVTEAFDFQLTETGRFVDPGVLYLVPEPDEPFRGLFEKIKSRFALAVSRKPVFHLTLAGWHPSSLDAVERNFLSRHGSLLPIAARAAEVCLYETRQGQWFMSRRFVLAKQG
jgi:hypothetical protein